MRLLPHADWQSPVPAACLRDTFVCLVLQVMMATGRVPKIQGLGLEQVGVQLGETGAFPPLLGAGHLAVPSLRRYAMSCTLSASTAGFPAETCGPSALWPITAALEYYGFRSIISVPVRHQHVSITGARCCCRHRYRLCTCRQAWRDCCERVLADISAQYLGCG